MILGLLAGFPYALVVSGDLSGEVRAWRMAHMEGLLNGSIMLIVAAVGSVLHVSTRQGQVLRVCMLVAGYGNVVAAIIAATFGVRGLAPEGPLPNWIVFLLFSAAIVGVLVGLGIVGLAARRVAISARHEAG
jgi:hypothetical protein